MFQIFKLLFPKLYFSFADDLNDGTLVPEGQPGDLNDGNVIETGGDKPADTPTDVELDGGVKVSQSVLDKWARETYKDRFEAYDNREKWQAENTRRAQENKQMERDADAYRRLQSDPNFSKKPDNTYEGKKRAYVEAKKSAFPNVDPRFFESQFQDLWEISGQRATESVNPIMERQAAEWERNFLTAHPLLKEGSEQYVKVRDLVGAGYDPEDAYEKVFRKELEDKRFLDRMKVRDEEAKRKLKQTRTPQSPIGSKATSRDEAFEKAWAKHGDS